MFIALFLSVGCCIAFPVIVNAFEETPEPCWCLKVQVPRSTRSLVCDDEKNKLVGATTGRKNPEAVTNNDKKSNETKVCDINGYSECVIRCTSGNMWHPVYQVIIVSAVLVLSILSEKLGGFRAVESTGEVFKRRNKFIEEIERIKRRGKSMKPFAIVEQDWKIDWSSDIWLGKDNEMETSSSVCIKYKKTQVKRIHEQHY